MKKNKFVINPEYIKKYKFKEIDFSSTRKLINSVTSKYFKSTYNYDELQRMKKQLNELEEIAFIIKSNQTHFEEHSDRTYTLVLSEMDQLKRKIFEMEKVQKEIVKIIYELMKNPDGGDED